MREKLTFFLHKDCRPEEGLSRFLPYDPEQAHLLSPSVKDELGADHLCFIACGAGAAGAERVRGPKGTEKSASVADQLQDPLGRITPISLKWVRCTRWRLLVQVILPRTGLTLRQIREYMPVTEDEFSLR